MILRKELKKNAKNQLKNNWLISIGVTIIATILLFLVDRISNYVINDESIIISILGMIITFFLSGLISVGVCKFFINLVNKSNPKFSDLWYGFNFNRVIKVCGVSLLLGIIITIGMLLLVVPGIIFALMYSQIYYILADKPNISIIECLKESSRIMKGHKIELFILELSFIGWIVLTIVTLGVAGLYYLPYYNTTLAKFYLEVKNEIEDDVNVVI